jgi:hypothetical protein
MDDLGIEDKLSIALIELMASWRNIVAHNTGDNRKLDREIRNYLLNEKEKVAELYANLRIDLAIKNFESRATPVPKEVTSLISSTVQLARSIDKLAILRVASTVVDVENSVDRIIRFYFSERGSVISRSFIADAWQGSKDRRVATLTKLLGSLGISKVAKPVSAQLRLNFVDDLAELSREQFETKYIDQ